MNRSYRRAAASVPPRSPCRRPAASAWAPAVDGDRPPGRPDVHRRRPVHRQLHLPGRHRHLHRPGRPLLGHRRRDRTDGCTRAVAAGRHAGRGHRRPQARDPGLQLVAHDAGARRDRRRHLRLQRPGAGQARPGRRREGQPVGARLRRPDRRRPSLGDTGATVYTYGNSDAARRRHEAEPEAGHRRPERRQRLEHGVYTVTPGIPGDSGSGFLNASGQAIGVLSTVAIAPLAGSNGVGDLAARARLHARPRRPAGERRQRHRAVQRRACSRAIGGA